MNFSKRKLYVLVLLLLIIFVSISFSLIINIREGLCLPSCDNVKFDKKTAKIPDCSPSELKLLQPNDASKIYSECINPFITSINSKIRIDYSYNLIETLYNTELVDPYYVQTDTENNYNNLKPEPNPILLKQLNDQKIIKSYFTDFTNNITLQDKMDNLVLNLSKIKDNFFFQNHKAFSNNKDDILISLKKYQDERNTAFIEIYKKLLKDIEPYGIQILIENECTNDDNKNYYKDETFRLLIKGEKENPVFYGGKSSFHNIYNYLQQAIQGKLGDVTS